MKKFAFAFFGACGIGLLMFGCGLAKQTTVENMSVEVEELHAANMSLLLQVDMLSTRVHQLELACIPPPQPEKSLSVSDRIRQVAKEEGYPHPDKLIKLAKCESGLNPKAKLVNRRERSYGVFQINLKAHRHITYEQATDVEWATRWSIKQIRIRGFRDWKNCSRKMNLH